MAHYPRVYTGGGASGATPSLSDVLLVNNTSSNSIILSDGVSSLILSPQSVFHNNTSTNLVNYIQDGGFVAMTSNGNNRIDVVNNLIRFKLGTAIANLSGNPLQTSLFTPTFQFPQKATNGTLTLATTEDYNLNSVLTNGNQTSLIANFSSGTKRVLVGPNNIELRDTGGNQMTTTIESDVIRFTRFGNNVTLSALNAAGSNNANYIFPIKNPGTYSLATTIDLYSVSSLNANTLNIITTGSGTNVNRVFNVRGLTSSNNTISIVGTGSNTLTNWAWDLRSLNGLPIGGTGGQILIKNSSTNYDTSWVNSSLLGFVPYTGANNNVNLGTYSLTSAKGLYQFTDNNNQFYVERNDYGYNRLYFYSEDTSGDDFGYVGLTINPEESISLSKGKTSSSEMGSFTLSQNLIELAVQNPNWYQRLNIQDGGLSFYIEENTTSQISEIYFNSDRTIFSREVQLPKVYFNSTGETSVEQALTWNDTQGTMNIGLKGGQTAVKSGVDLVVRIVNKVTPNTTLTKANYQAVRISGAQGQRLAVEFAQADNDNNSADTIGLVCETIATNQEGYIMTVGQLEGVNTTGSLQGETWADGDVLYLSPTTAGRLTNIKPTAPDHIVVMGYVEYAHSVNGKIYVKIMNGWELDELHNVKITGTPSNGQILVYGTSSVWENKDNLLLEATDVRSWQVTNRNLSVSTSDGTPNGLFFKPDGTRMYFSGGSNDRIYQYDLSTAWDASTAVLNNSLLVSGQDSGLADMYISPDGTRMYLVGSTNDRIYQYTLSSAWDVMSATFINSLLVSSYSTVPTGIYFKPDGTKCFILDDQTDNVFGITLGTAWDITTGTQTETFSVAAFDNQIQAISFNNDGSIMYILGAQGDDITQFSLSTPWNITTATYVIESFTFNAETTPGGLYYNETAGVAYIVGSNVDIIYGMITTRSRLYTNKTIEANQGHFGRLEATGEVVFNGALRTNNVILAGSSITTAGSLFVGGNGSILTAANIGNNATATTHNFVNGAHTTGNKIANFGTGGLNGSTTTINIGSNIGTTLNYEAIENNFRGTVNVDKALHVEGIDINKPATGTVLFSDTFTEAVTTNLQSHIPDVGSGWTKSFSGTTANINVFGGAGNAGSSAAINNLGFIYTTNNTFTNPDYEISTNITAWVASDDPLWIIFRYIDNSNFYGVRLSLTSTDFRLYKVVAGVATILNGSINIPLTNTSQVFRVRVVGSAISLLLDSTLLGTWYDSDLTAAGKCGIGMGNIGVGLTADDISTTWRLNDFKVQQYTQTDIEQVSYIRTGSLVLGATTATASAKLQVNSTTQGFLPPRMTNAQRLAIAIPAVGLMVYCTDTTEGLYIYKSTGWTFII